MIKMSYRAFARIAQRLYPVRAVGYTIPLSHARINLGQTLITLVSTFTCDDYPGLRKV